MVTSLEEGKLGIYLKIVLCRILHVAEVVGKYKDKKIRELVRKQFLKSLGEFLSVEKMIWSDVKTVRYQCLETICLANIICFFYRCDIVQCIFFNSFENFAFLLNRELLSGNVFRELSICCNP